MLLHGQGSPHGMGIIMLSFPKDAVPQGIGNNAKALSNEATRGKELSICIGHAK